MWPTEEVMAAVTPPTLQPSDPPTPVPSANVMDI